METRQPTREEIALNSLVEHATEDLTPNRHYSLEIGDIALRQSSLRTFEQMFDHSLERTGKAKTILAFDETANQLYPRSIHLPLDKSNIHASLLYTDSALGYIPTFSSTPNDHKSILLSLPNPSQEELMNMLDIEQPPSHEAHAYRLWLSQLLERSDSWSLHEQLETPVSIGDNHISSLIFRHYVKIHNEKARTVRSITHKTSIPVSRDENIVMHTTLETGSDDSYDVELRAYKELGTQEPRNLFNPKIKWQRRESMPLNNEDNISPLLQMAHDAIEARQSE